MDNDNLFDKEDKNGEQPYQNTEGQPQQQPYQNTEGQPQQQPYQNTEGQPQQQPYQNTEGQYQQPYRNAEGQYQQPYQNADAQYQSQQSYNQYQQYSQPQQPYQQMNNIRQPNYMSGVETEEPVSFGDWMVTLLLSYIPCVNLIVLLIWAFGSTTKKSKSNFAKAKLVWMIVGTVLSTILAFVYIGTIIALLDNNINFY